MVILIRTFCSLIFLDCIKCLLKAYIYMSKTCFPNNTQDTILSSAFLKLFSIKVFHYVQC